MTNEEFLRSISLEGEEWRDIEGFEGLYVISSKGRVVSLGRLIQLNNHSVKTSPCLIKTRRSNKKTTHQLVRLYKNNRENKRYIHRLVASAFLPNVNNMPIVEHLDCDPTNNDVANLRWTDQKGNMNNPITLTRLSSSQKGRTNPTQWHPVAQLKDGVLVGKYESISAAVRQGYNQVCISLCCTGRYKSHKGYQWMYLEDFENLNTNDVKELLK